MPPRPVRPDPTAVEARTLHAALSALVLAAALLSVGATALARAGRVTLAERGLTVHLHTPQMQLRGEPEARAVIGLYQGSDVLALAEGRLDGDGSWTARLEPVGGRPASDNLLRPGRTLSLTLGGVSLPPITLPRLVVRDDAPSARMLVEGSPPPSAGAEAILAFEGPAGELSRSTFVPLAGRPSSVAWPAGWRARDGYAARLDWPLARDITVTTRWDAPHVEATLGGRSLRGVAPHGARLAASVQRGGATRLEGTTEPLSGEDARDVARFTLSLHASDGLAGEGDAAVLRAGDALSVSLDGRTLFERTAPLIRSRIRPSLDIVSGLAPPETVLRVDARTQDVRATREVSVSASGAFSVHLGTDLDLRDDSEVWVSLQEDDRPVVWRSRAEAERVTVTLGSARLHGRAAPYSTVAASLKDAAGASTVAEGVADSGAGGAFTLTLAADGQPVAAEAGSRLLAVWELGGAVDATLPELYATFAPSTGRVTGFAPPGSRLRVRLTGAQRRFVRDVSADADGRFMATFAGAGQSDVWRGEAALYIGERLTLVRRFAHVRATAELDRPTLGLVGPPAAAVEVRLRRGELLLGGASTILGTAPSTHAPSAARERAEDECAPCETRLVVRDAEGFPVPLVAGDTVDLIVDGQITTLEVPRMALEANATLGRVLGNALPVAELTLVLGRGREASAALALAPDEAGVFEIQPAREGAWTLAGGDSMTLTARSGALSFLLRAEVAGLHVDLESGTVSGLAGPGERLSAGLYDTRGARRAQGAASADGEGRFSFQLRDPLGGALQPQAGESLVVQAGTRVTTTRMPELHVAADALADRLEGRLTPRGRLWIRAERPDGDRGRRLLTRTTTLAADWSLPLANRLDVAAGTRLQVAHHDENGHRFARSLRLPQLHARVGDAMVHGQVGAQATVWLTVTRGAAVLSSATRKATPEGAFEAEMAAGPARWRLAPGDRVEATWQGGHGAPRSGRMRMLVTAVTAALDPLEAVVIGASEPKARLSARFSDGGLPSDLPAVSTQADPDGSYRLPAPIRSAFKAGATVEVGLRGPLGHRSYALDRLPYLDLRMDRAVLTGRATPRRPLTLTLLGGDQGSPAIVATRALTAGAQGSFVTAFTDARQHDVPLAAGMAIVITETTGRTSTVQLPRLSVTIDRSEQTVLGVAPPGARVELRLFFFGRPAQTLQRTVDDQGRWELALASLPSSLPFDDLRRVEARLATAQGHRVVAVAEPAQPPPTATPTRDSSPTPIPARATPVTPTPNGTATSTPDPLRETSTPSATRPPDGGPWTLYLPYAGRTTTQVVASRNEPDTVRRHRPAVLAHRSDDEDGLGD